MPVLYRFTRRAFRDLRAIQRYIAMDNEEAAGRVMSAILDTCAQLGQFPMLGRKRPEITDRPIRFRLVSRFPNYIVLYRPDTRPIRIIAITHGMRDLKAMLADPKFRA